MLNKERLEHPERFEVTVYDTATEEIVREFRCFGAFVGQIQEVDIKDDEEAPDGTYYSTQPVGFNACAEDAATMIYSLLEMFPEAKTILEEMTIVTMEEGEEDADEDHD